MWRVTPDVVLRLLHVHTPPETCPSPPYVHLALSSILNVTALWYRRTFPGHCWNEPEPPPAPELQTLAYLYTSPTDRNVHIGRSLENGVKDSGRHLGF